MLKLVAAFLALAGKNFFPAGSAGDDDIFIGVPSEWHHEQPERWHHARDELNKLADQIVTAHQDLVRSGRRILRL